MEQNCNVNAKESITVRGYVLIMGVLRNVKAFCATYAGLIIISVLIALAFLVLWIFLYGPLYANLALGNMLFHYNYPILEKS